MQEPVGVRIIREFHFFAVPSQPPAAVANTGNAELNGFRQRSGKIKIGTGFGAGFTGFNPFLIVANF
jgi:hypothetical protein